jgi:hypothetical protein
VPLYVHETVDVVSVPGAQAAYLAQLQRDVTSITNVPGSIFRNVAIWIPVWAFGNWPQVVCLWEMERWEDFFGEHLSEDPVYGVPQDYYHWRSGGFDRFLLASAWTPTVAELASSERRAPAVLQDLDDLGQFAGRPDTGGGSLLAGYKKALHDGTEVVIYWAFESFGAFSNIAAESVESPVVDWHEASRDKTLSRCAALLAPAPWSPLH